MRSTRFSIRTRHRVPESRHQRGLIDTSVVIDLERLSRADLPTELAIASITLAELAAAPHATDDPEERARREVRLQHMRETFDALPFDSAAAQVYGQIYAAVRRAGRSARGRRAIDLLIAATALAAGLPLYTRNPDDFTDLTELIEIVAVPETGSPGTPA